MKQRTLTAILALVLNGGLYLALLSALIYAENPLFPALPLLLIFTCTLLGSLLYFLYVPARPQAAGTPRTSRSAPLPRSRHAEG